MNTSCKERLLANIEYLEREWSEKVVENFIFKLYETIS